MNKHFSNCYPYMALVTSSWKQYQNGKIKAVIYNNDCAFSLEELESFISPEFFINGTLLIGFTTEQAKDTILKLAKPIKGTILVDNTSKNRVLPIHPKNFYLENDNRYIEKENCYKIELGFNERTLNDLIQNNYKYKLDINTNTFLPIFDEKVWKKRFIARKIRKKTENLFDTESLVPTLLQAIYHILHGNSDIVIDEIDQTFNALNEITDKIYEEYYADN